MENNAFEVTGSSAVAPASTNWKPWAAGGVLLATMMCGSGALYLHGNKLENELKSMQSNTASELAALKSANSAQADAHQRNLAEMNAQIERAQTNVRNFAAVQARVPHAERR